MIRVSDQIPNITTMHKKGSKTFWLETHEIFRNKKILLLGIPGVFIVEYASSQIKTFEFYYDNFINLGIDQIYFTSTDDVYVQQAWMKSENIVKIKNLPDPAGSFAASIGMLEDMTREGLSDKRSHRYAMTIDNLICKNVKYEDFTHNPMTCFQVTDADTMLKYFESIQTNYERWNDNARDKVDNLGRNKINSVLS